MAESNSYDIPMTLPSCANLREHWRSRAQRAKEHRELARRMGKIHNNRPLQVGERATITLTRIAPRGLDSDNVASAFKAYRDGLADALGVDDGSPFLDWRYAQEKGTARVRVTIVYAERVSDGKPTLGHGGWGRRPPWPQRKSFSENT